MTPAAAFCCLETLTHKFASAAMVQHLKLMSLLSFCVQGLDAAGFEPYVQQLEKNFAKGIRLGVESEANQPQVHVQYTRPEAVQCVTAHRCSILLQLPSSCKRKH